MTKPLGNPKSRENQDTQGTFYGHPVVIRVKDLTWEPPVEEQPAGTQDWVSNLLGEDPTADLAEESLLVEAPTAPIMPPQPAAMAPAAVEVASAPVASASTAAPSYIHHRGEETRQARRESILSGQWRNRIYLAGMAVSLLVASAWLLSGDDDSIPPVDDVDQGLFVSTGELGSAPSWDATPGTDADNETITVSPLDTAIPMVATKPDRTELTNPTMGNPSQDTQMTNIASGYEPEGSIAPPYNNPASNQQLPPEPMAPEDEYYQFRPEGMESAPTGAGSYSPSFNPATDEDYTPQFDGRPSASPGMPSGGPSLELNAPATSQYSVPNGDSGRHWMQQPTGNFAYEDGKLTQRTAATNPANSQPQLPQIHEGYQPQPGMPMIGTPTQPTYSQTAPQNPSQGGFGFTPYENREATPPGARLGSVDLDSDIR